MNSLGLLSCSCHNNCFILFCPTIFEDMLKCFFFFFVVVVVVVVFFFLGGGGGGMTSSLNTNKHN